MEKELRIIASKVPIQMAKGGIVNKNWIVRIYDEDDNVIDKFIIQDRAKHDAESEAENEMDRRSQHQDYADWTISEHKATGGLVYLDGARAQTFKTNKALREFIRNQATTGVKKVEVDYGNRIIPTFDTWIIEDGRLIHKGELIQPNYDKAEAEKRRVETELYYNKILGK